MLLGYETGTPAYSVVLTRLEKRGVGQREKTGRQAGGGGGMKEEATGAGEIPPTSLHSLFCLAWVISFCVTAPIPPNSCLCVDTVDCDLDLHTS